jgi:hypothetical protein
MRVRGRPNIGRRLTHTSIAFCAGLYQSRRNGTKSSLTPSALSGEGHSYLLNWRIRLSITMASLRHYDGTARLHGLLGKHQVEG